jgi:hypothetical protein
MVSAAAASIASRPPPGDDVKGLQGPGQHHRVPHGDGRDHASEPDGLGDQPERHRQRQRVEHVELRLEAGHPMRWSVA